MQFFFISLCPFGLWLPVILRLWLVVFMSLILGQKMDFLYLTWFGCNSLCRKCNPYFHVIPSFYPVLFWDSPVRELAATSRTELWEDRGSVGRWLERKRYNWRGMIGDFFMCPWAGENPQDSRHERDYISIIWTEMYVDVRRKVGGGEYCCMG